LYGEGVFEVKGNWKITDIRGQKRGCLREIHTKERGVSIPPLRPLKNSCQPRFQPLT